MAVVSVTELARKNEYEIGKTRKLTREFVVVLSDNSLDNTAGTNRSDVTDVAAFVPIDLGYAHPTYKDYGVRKITYTEHYEGSPYHVHLLCEYGLILESETVAPQDRDAVWEFDGGLGEIPATYFYDAEGTQRPLTNSAYDFFPGLMTSEALVTARVTKNYLNFPSALLSNLNCLNSELYFGCPQHTLKVASINIMPADEDFGSTPRRYWQAVIEVQYRQSGHNYQLPDIGWNYIDGGQKRRCMTFDFENSEWVASPNPLGLDGNGGISPTGWPAILVRRVCPETDFQALLGDPPTTASTLYVPTPYTADSSLLI